MALTYGLIMKNYTLIAVIIVSMIAGVKADPIHVEFSGYVEYNLFDFASLLYFGVFPQDEFSCAFSYDPDTIAHCGSEGVDPDMDYFQHPPPLADLGLALHVNSYSGLEMCTDPVDDGYLMQVCDSGNSSQPGRITIVTMPMQAYLPGKSVTLMLELYDPLEPILFNGDGFPSIDMAGFTGGKLVVSCQDNWSYRFTGNITMVTIVTDELPVEELCIDIKPGSDLNPINLKSRGGVPVAVYGTENVDVTLIDDPFEVILYDVDSPECVGASPIRWSLDDINRDGYTDILFHFKTTELRDYFDEHSDAACLAGLTIDGRLFMGVDVVHPSMNGK